MEVFVYNGDNISLQQLLELNSKGAKILCSKCGAELLIICGVESEKKYKKKSGIYCTINEQHIRQWFSLAEPRQEFWRRFAPSLLEEQEDPD